MIAIIIIIICIRHPTEHHHNYFFTLLFAVSTVVVDPDPRMVGSAIVFLALLPPDTLSLVVVSTRLVDRLVPVVGLLPIPVEDGSSLGIAWFDRLLFIARLFIARVFMSTLD